MPSQLRPLTLNALLQNWAERSPDAPAILDPNRQSLTYAGLHEVLHSVRRSLNGWGFGRNDRLAVVHSGGAAMAATLIGIGGCATAFPLNPNHRLGEFAILMKDAGVKALVVEAGLENPAREAARLLRLPIIEIMAEADNVAGRMVLKSECETREAALPGSAELDDDLVIIATSGTTAYSKLVAIKHRQAYHRGLDMSELLKLRPEDRGLSMMPLYHIGGVSANLWACLFSGGSVAPLGRIEIPTFFRSLERIKPSFVSASYTVYHAIQAQAERYAREIAAVRPDIRMLRAGTGHLDSQVAAALEVIFDAPVIQAYGSTETGFMTCEPLPPKAQKAGSVGLPGRSEVVVLGETGAVLTPGEAGEVAVRGGALFERYLNDPEATAAAFTDGWYRTGDEGYFDEDGYLFLTGRIKEVINRGGQKISPAEIDAALQRHPAVAMACAYPVSHPTLGEDVAAAVVLQEGSSATADMLRTFLREQLAPYKVPRQVRFLETLPVGSSGKVSRRLLASELADVGEATVDAVDRKTIARAPTPLEAQLQGLWAEALGRRSVGLNEDFFVLGGDSLQAVELFLRVEEALDRRLPRSILIEANTVEEMARLIESAAPPSNIVPIQTKGAHLPFFCVHDVGGDVLSYRLLSQYLGEGQPFYGLRSALFEAEDKPVLDMNELADNYLWEIRKVQPVGPYYLGGHSFGGQVAYIMAQKLHAAGESVALLALLDTFSGVGRRTEPLAQWLRRHSDALLEVPFARWPGYFGRRVVNLAAYGLRRLDHYTLPIRHRYRKLRDLEPAKDVQSQEEANFVMSWTYRPKPYKGDAVLFRAELAQWKHPSVHTGWRKLIKGKLEVVPISGIHTEILKEPHVQTLAEKLLDCLRQRQPDAQST